MKRTISASLLALSATLATTGTAQAQDVSWSIGTDYVTEYVFRGVSLAEGAFQPYAEASVGNFTAGIWASTGVGAGSELYGDEIDFYAGYSVPLDGPLSLDLGVTYYHYPQGGALFETEDGSAGTYEVSAAVGFGDVMLAPSIAAYYDFTLENFTLEGAIGHSVGFGEKNGLDLGLTVGAVEADGGGDYQWAHGSVALSHSLTDDASVYVGANYAINSEDNTLDYERIAVGADEVAVLSGDDKLWFAVGISAGF